MSVIATLQASYFFLSYAHSPPLAGTPQSSHDPWIRTFFADLSTCVRRLGSQQLGIGPGFIDQEIPLDADWRTALLQALSTAEVFVPLYSPGYFAGSWPGREWACFERRLTDARVLDPLARFAPVLWIPLKPGESPDGLRAAMAIGEGESAYAENGLRAMLRLTPYHEAYLRIVERLAGMIVDLAERETISPSPAPDIDEISSPFGASSSAVFAVAVASPEDSGMRSFPENQDLSLPEYVATVAEQLDFAVSVTGLDQAVDQFGSTPGIILIDPRFAADNRRLDSLRHAVRGRPWVLPLIVVSPTGPPDSPSQEPGQRPAASDAELVQRVRLALGVTSTRSDPVGKAVAGVGSLEEFVMLIPFLVAEAERQFLRRGPIMRAIAPTGSRPRLRSAWTNLSGDAVGSPEGMHHPDVGEGES
jgi:hypothetical protein